jgi:hypothetical protein
MSDEPAGAVDGELDLDAAIVPVEQPALAGGAGSSSTSSATD